MAWDEQRVPRRQPAQQPGQHAQAQAWPRAGSLQRVEALPVRLCAPTLT